MAKRMKLLIASDGSGCADAALDDLNRAGLPDAAEVLVLSVADVFLPPNSGAADPHDPEWLVAAVKQAYARASQKVEEARATAEAASKRLQSDHPGWDVHPEACADSPAWAVVDKASQWEADLVVVGAHGHSGTRRLLLGSVSQRVVYDAQCSVRVARTPKSDKDSPARLIVGVDGSSDSDMALREVAARIWPAGTEVRVVTALDSLVPVSLALASLDPATAILSNSSNIHSGTSINSMNQAASEMLRDAGLSVSSLVTEGNPKEILVKEAKRWKADCIFVGAKGLRGIKRFLLGGVSAAVTARAPCSVEVVRPK